MYVASHAEQEDPDGPVSLTWLPDKLKRKSDRWSGQKAYTEEIKAG